jgi:hypothetical protein
MNEATTPPLPQSVDAWRGDFMDAARRHAARRRSPLRRLLALLPVIVVLGSASVAAAAIDESTEPDVPPYAGETHGYVDLATGEPILCPDGNLLTYTPPVDNPVYGTPHCSDGSVPPAYTEQREALLEHFEDVPFGVPGDTGPRFDFEVDGDE